MFDLATATQLPNDAIILARHIPTKTVLCQREHSYQPFVTWKVDDEGNAYWGHYFERQETALRAFADRVLLSCGM
jgi:hypothetical protein